MKMRKIDGSKVPVETRSPGITFESEADRDRAMEMIDAMEWLDEHKYSVRLFENEAFERWECYAVCRPTGPGATPWDAILAAKEASEP